MDRTLKHINSAKDPIIYCNPHELQGYIFGVYETVTMGAKSDTRTMPLFAAPPQIEPTRLMLIPELLEKIGWVQKKEWVALTDDEYQAVLNEHDNGGLLAFYNLIEAKLREKNGG